MQEGFGVHIQQAEALTKNYGGEGGSRAKQHVQMGFFGGASCEGGEERLAKLSSAVYNLILFNNLIHNIALLFTNHHFSPSTVCLAGKGRL